MVPASLLLSPALMWLALTGAPGSQVVLYTAESPTAVHLLIAGQPAESGRPLAIARAFDGSSVGVVIPDDAPVGGAAFFSFYTGGRFRVEELHIAPVHYRHSPETGSPVAVADQMTATGGSRRVQLTNPATPGARVTLWGTGLGARPFDRLLNIQVGGATIAAQFAERLTDGRDRVEFTVPSNVQQFDCYSPLYLSVDNTTYFAGTIPLSEDGSPCRHRLGLGLPEMVRLDNGEKLPIATFDIEYVIAGKSQGYRAFEQAVFAIQPLGGGEIAALAGTAGIPRTGCAILFGDDPPVFARSPFPGVPSGAQPSLELHGPGDRRFDLAPYADSAFRWMEPNLPQLAAWAEVPAPRIVAGEWTLQMPQGLTPDRLPVRVPAHLKLLDAIPVTLDAGALIRWQTEGLSTNDRIRFEFTPAVGPRYLACEASALDGQLTVPQSLIDQLGDSASRANGALRVSLQPRLDSQLFRLDRQEGATKTVFGLIRVSSSVTQIP